MTSTIYIEEQVMDHPRVWEIVGRFPNATQIVCDRYNEIFNLRSQDFRLQKKSPNLILARKEKGLALPAPDEYGIGADRNYYFSHMLNCIYDCRYCFLQGMYQSASYVVFVNYEDFQQEIIKLSSGAETETCFFSGYDCDSLAYEPVTGFAREFLPFFGTVPNATLELRTKSTQIRSLTNRDPISNCVVAFSLNPQEIIDKLEHRSPDLGKRLKAIQTLSRHGWRIGLRFDPLIYTEEYRDLYGEFFRQVFDHVNADLLHSVSLGSFRLPDQFYKKVSHLYPEDRLFGSPLISRGGLTQYEAGIEEEFMGYCRSVLLDHVPESRLYHCAGK